MTKVYKRLRKYCRNKYGVECYVSFLTVIHLIHHTTTSAAPPHHHFSCTTTPTIHRHHHTNNSAAPPHQQFSCTTTRTPPECSTATTSQVCDMEWGHRCFEGITARLDDMRTEVLQDCVHHSAGPCFLVVLLLSATTTLPLQQPHHHCNNHTTIATTTPPLQQPHHHCFFLQQPHHHCNNHTTTAGSVGSEVPRHLRNHPSA